MARTRYITRSLRVEETVPFSNAEEAWLWYAQCQTARDDGVRFTAGLAAIPRPCEPDDIAREARRLYRQRVLQQAHLMVLMRFGRRMNAPSPLDCDQDVQAPLWDEALDRLTTPLRRKGNVA